MSFIQDYAKTMLGGAGYLKDIASEIMNGNKATYVKQYAPAPTAYQIKDRNLSVTPQDLEEAKHVIFGEVSNHGPEFQTAETKMILNTALNRMKEYEARGTPKTLTEVLQQRNQYQAYRPKEPTSQYFMSKQDTLDELSRKKRQVVEDTLNTVQAGNFADDTKGMVYYVHNQDGSITLKPGKLFK